MAVVLGDWTGIPISKILEAESDKLLKMEARLAERVVGQEEAVRAVSRDVRRGRIGGINPGWIEFARMRSLPNWTAVDLVSVRTAPFDAL